MTEETQVAPVAETQNPAPEVTETPAVVTPEVAEAEPTESEESKALKRMQRRIDKRTADVYRERANNEQLAQRLAELERRLQPAADQQSPGADLEKVVQNKAQTLAQEIAQQQKVTDSIGAVLKAGKALENFDAACNTVAEELPFYVNGRPTAFLSSVLEFDQPAQLLHHLGTHPDLAAELADLNPTQLIRRLDRIERDLTEKAKPKPSAAPKPLEPVRGQGIATGYSPEMSDAAYAKWRKAQKS